MASETLCSETFILQGRPIAPTDLLYIRTLLTETPPLNRHRISIKLAEQWNWRTATGQLKDMAARTLLLKLHQRQLIVLPPRRRNPPGRAAARPPERLRELFNDPLPDPIDVPLAQLTPIHLEVVKAGHPAWKRLAAHFRQHHYLGYSGPVGENLLYLATDRRHRDLAAILFGAAAWKTQPRDQWIGWDPATRQKHLPFIVNNSRFLVLPWVRVPHLASHLLARVTRRLCADWQRYYGHPVYLAETFVEKNRFKGTCYKAANWTHVGQTVGRGRQDRWNTASVPVKDIFLYPLVAHCQQRLRHVQPV